MKLDSLIIGVLPTVKPPKPYHKGINLPDVSVNESDLAFAEGLHRNDFTFDVFMA